MDLEKLRLEREEKRRLRRERIRRILEDDGTPSRHSKQDSKEKDVDSSHNQRSAATRKQRGHASSASEAKTHSKQEESEKTPDNKSPPEKSTRSRRNRGELTSSSGKMADGGSSLGSIRAKRDARRRRNQEHDLIQNKVTTVNGELDKMKTSVVRDHSRFNGGSSKTKEESVAVGRRRGRDSSKSDSKKSMSERVSNETATEVHGRNINETESKDSEGTDLNVDDISPKRVNDYEVETEKVEQIKMDDTKVGALEKVQDSDNKLDEKSECKNGISRDIKNVIEITREAKEVDEVKNLDVKEVNVTGDVEKVLEVNAEQMEEGVEKVGKKEDVEEGKKMKILQERNEIKETGGTDKAEELGKGRYDSNEVPSINESYEEMKTDIGTVNLNEVHEVKNNELEKEMVDDVTRSIKSESNQPVADDGSIVTTKIGMSVENDSSKGNKPVEVAAETLGEERTVLTNEDHDDAAKPSKEETDCDQGDTSEVTKSPLSDMDERDSSRKNDENTMGAIPLVNIAKEVDGDSVSVTKDLLESSMKTDWSSGERRKVSETIGMEGAGNASVVEKKPKASGSRSERPSRGNKQKVADDSWKKNERRKKKVVDQDRTVELRVLGRTGKIKDKLKSCETRDVENSDLWKKEVKKRTPKQNSPDDETQKEIKELSGKSDLKNRVKSCEERDQESTETYKREVKKDVRKHKSLDEGIEAELKELSKTIALKTRIKECEEMDKESSEAWKREVKKDVRKHKSLDEATENELKELSKASALKSRITECEEKDQERTGTLKKEVKEGDRWNKTAEEGKVSNDLKELAESGRLKNLIASCAERDEIRDEAWKSAKNQKKETSVGEEAELKELSNLRDLRNKIIQSCEERDKESAEASNKEVISGETTKLFDETREEELMELSRTVDVKTQLQSRIQEQEKPKEMQDRLDPTEEEGLRNVNHKSRFEAFNREGQRLLAETSKRADTETVSRIVRTDEDTLGTKSPADGGSLSDDTGLAERSLAKEERPGEISSEPNALVNEIPETKQDIKGRLSPTREDTRSGSTSPTKRNMKGRESPVKDDSYRGRTSPTKRDLRDRDSPNKDDVRGGRSSPIKRDTKERVSPPKEKVHTKSKLENIRSNLYDGSKNNTKNKRDSLERISKTVSIKDKIAACKERDKMLPRRLPVEKVSSKAKPKAEPEKAAGKKGVKVQTSDTGTNEVAESTPVNHMGDQFVSIEEETQDVSIKDALSFWQKPRVDKEPSVGTEAQNDRDEEVVDVDIKGKMSYWETPQQGRDETSGSEQPTNESERPATVILGNMKHGWQKKGRKLNVDEFIKELLNAKCRRRDLKEIHEVQSDTKKYLMVKKGEEKVRGSSVSDEDFERLERVEKSVEVQNKKNAKLSAVDSASNKVPDDFSFDDVVNPNEVKQLRDFSDFRRQVKPTNRRAAKSNPVRKLQQREDLKTETEIFNDASDEEDSPPKPTAIGRLGRPIDPADRRSREINTFSRDALAGLSAKEDVSKITLKKTAKSKTGVSQEKSEHDGTAPVMLMQIKGHRHMQTRLVEPSVESLNSGDTFLLVTDKHLHVWLGKDANVMKKSKASELSNKILQYKLLNCSASVITIIKDGAVNVETGLTRTFWNLLGGKKSVKSAKQVPKDSDYEKAVVSTNVIYSVDTSCEPAKLVEVSELCGKLPSIKMLDSDKAFVFDFGTEVYAWLGRTCDKSTRNKAVDLAQEVFKGTFKVKSSPNPISPNSCAGKDKHQELKRPSWAVFGRMTERAETILFEQKFSDWPDAAMKAKLDKQKDLLNKNLSSGYAKRKAKMEKTEVQIIELVPYDGAKMAEEPPPVKMVLEGVNLGRGRGSYDEIERRGITITTNSVTVYHSSEKEYRQLEEKEWGHFYSAESYIIRWSYSVKASGIRSLKGGDSKHETSGRDQIAYFFWHGRDCSASGKGTSALATIELDSDKSPQIMVDEGNESACFLNMFDGQMIVHHGKLNDRKCIEEDNVLMYCVHHEDEREINLIQIEARSSNLRSRSSFVVVVIEMSIGICVWHGAKSTKEKKEGALRGAKRLGVWFKELFTINKLDVVELEEGNEGLLFWEALAGKDNYGSLKQSDRKCDYRVRLFNFTSTEGPFIAKEIPNPTRGELVSPYPFRQSELYSAPQPALFLLDAVHEMYLWQGWWPVNPDNSDSSATTTGSAEFRWHRDRRLAMQTIQSYADVVGRQMSKSYVVSAGLEPVEFRAFFPFWEDHPDVTQINLESGKTDGGKASLPDLLKNLSRDQYSLAELRVRPLPEGVDPSKMEMYLSDEEFKAVFKMSKNEFTKLPKWKKLEQRKMAGLF